MFLFVCFSSSWDVPRSRFLKLLMKQKSVGTDIITYKIVGLCVHFFWGRESIVFRTCLKGWLTPPLIKSSCLSLLNPRSLEGPSPLPGFCS